MANLEREMEEALGLPPRAKYTSTAVQDTADLLDKEIAEAESAGISQEPPTASDIANTVIDFTPIIGDIKGGVEGAEVIFEELGKDDPNFLLIGVVGGAGVVGLIPGVGDAAQKLIMQGARRFKKTELNPEVMEVLTPKDQETVEILTKNTLPTPETDGERLADEVATMLREGKAGDLTDEMLETAGNDFHTRLTQHYIDGNVGMDLPMDWESTMARAADQGLTETRYHGSNVKDIPFFKGQGAKRQTGMFNTDDPFKAFSYEGKNGETYSLLMQPLPEDTPRVDVEGANWSNLDEPSMNYYKDKLSPDVRQGPRMDRQVQPLDEYLQEQTGNLTSDMFMRKASQLGYPGATIENVVDRGPSTPIRFSKEEGLKARNLASQPSQTQARTDTTGIRSIGARFDPRLTGLKNINMAQGGLTSMNDQTQRAFALGGEAETVDPVSGNDVPPGSLPEEVRDDIDAKLSEGEYVVPADVVRFFGVKFFEDLRTEAKMSLQQMDADGRIGGDPVPAPEQEDSMDVAELKAALSESGMYAGGLTDGGSLDTFIDDASRDPMVNGRMRASGATVKMAVGGLAIGNYGDVTKVDGIIKQLMTAANKDPALMEKLASKGIMVNKTGADKKSAEMQQANKPQEPIEAAEGTYVNPFDMGSFDTLGANLFKAAGIKDPVKVIEDTFIKPEGVIEQIVLIGPDGMEIPVAWNSATPIPEGFTKKATNEYGVQANVPTTVSPVAISTQGSRQTGDEGDNGGGEDEPTSTSTGSSFSYTGANLSALEEKYEETKKYANLSNLALVLGPVGGVIKMAVQANHAIVKRRIENELERREKISVDEKGKYDPTGNSFTNLEGEISTLKELKAKVGTKSASTSLLGYLVGDVVDKAFDSIAESKDKKAAADLIQEDVIMQPLKGSGFEDSGLPAAFSDSFLSSKQKGYTYNTADDGKGRDITVKPETGLEKVTRLKREQEVATARRLEKERKEREAREAAQRAAAATAARNSAAQREIDRLNRENRDDSDPWAFDIGSDPAFTSGDADYNSKPSYGSISSGGLYQEGGLVSMPAAAKKQKKRKTQRRKGLGTRP